MGLRQEDFALTEEQLDSINAHVQARRQAYASQAEVSELPEISVRFVFLPVYGRFLYLHFDGEKNEKTVEFASNFLK